MNRTEQAAAAVVSLYREAGGMPPTVRAVTQRMGMISPADGLKYLRRASLVGLVRAAKSGTRTCYLPPVGPYCPVCGHLAEPRRATLTGS